VSAGTAVAARRPAKRAGEQPVPCFCSRPEAEHPTGSCARFQARPCACGHAHAAHLGVCRECDRCKMYRADQTPEFLLRAGVHAGEWSIQADARLRALMRPGNEMKVRVYACGLLHATRRRLATRIDEQGRRVPLAPADIVRTLNALERGAGRANDQNVYRALVDLESEGMVRREGRARGNVRLYFYFRPLTAKRVDRSVSQNLVTFDQNRSVSDSDINHLSESIILHMQSLVVKSALAGVRKLAEIDPEILVRFDQNTEAREILDHLADLVKSDYIRLLNLVKNGGAYKEASSITSREEPGPESSSSSVAIEDPAVAAEATTTSPPPFDPSAPLTRSLFERELTASFVDAGKPAPTAKQSARAFRELPSDARGYYIEDLRRRIAGVNSPGVLITDVPAFAAAWPRIKLKREAEWRQRQEFAARREKQRAAQQQQAGEFEREMRRAAADPAHPDHEFAREYLRGAPQIARGAS
jgi:hypothetical protein